MVLWVEAASAWWPCSAGHYVPCLFLLQPGFLSLFCCQADKRVYFPKGELNGMGAKGQGCRNWQLD